MLCYDVPALLLILINIVSSLFQQTVFVPGKDFELGPFFDRHVRVGGDRWWRAVIPLERIGHVEGHGEGALAIGSRTGLDEDGHGRSHCNLHLPVVLTRNVIKQFPEHHGRGGVSRRVLQSSLDPFLGRVEPFFIILPRYEHLRLKVVRVISQVSNLFCTNDCVWRYFQSPASNGCSNRLQQTTTR